MNNVINPFYNIRILDMDKIREFYVSNVSDDLYNQIMEANERFLEMKYSKMPNLSNNKSYDKYAEIIVDGKVVVEINNHGWLQASDTVASKLQEGLSSEINGKMGPELAQVRAEEIAELLGGEIKLSSTAISQSEFNKIPVPKITVDYEAMKQDEMYIQMQKNKEARSLFLAQQVGQENIPIKDEMLDYENAS